MSQCRSCGAEITWAVNRDSGKREPLGAAPRPDGNIEVSGTVIVEGERQTACRHLKKADLVPSLLEPPPRYVSHFATCVHAAHHRKR